ncbi:hypothetical protein KCU62_g1893, partial [Aureobasidium sp. EXF-3399]
MSEQQLLGAFSSALGEADSESTFACGGQIPVILGPTTGFENEKSDVESQIFDQVIMTKPVTIRYGAPGQGQTLRLPTKTTKDPGFLNLISTCEPATFGREGRDVYDEQYRKATKLDTSDFCTDFCPYETGIIDIVSQLLMPSIKRKVADSDPSNLYENSPAIKADVEMLHAAIEGSDDTDTMTVMEIVTSRSPADLSLIMDMYKARYKRNLDQVLEQKLEGTDLALLHILAEHGAEGDGLDSAMNEDNANNQINIGIRAELYKLNIYSGPSGKFKAHVDTPRSETQVGSLVLCLPSEFDWSPCSQADQTPCIQWAAFYSDCSHEVQEVTAGHRVTLTYNLYASRGSGLLAGQKTSMDATCLPVYRPLIDLLRSHTFMNEGGFMAIGLAHAYPYTHALLHKNMPAALKGADMMLYEALLALNLRTELIRVMDLSEVCAELRANEYDGNDYEDDEDDRLAFQSSKNDIFYRPGFEAMKISDRMVEEHELRNGMPGWDRLGPVKWIRHPRDSQLEIAHLAYGNEASMATKYSQAAIVVSVPALQLRLQVLGSSIIDLTLSEEA